MPKPKYFKNTDLFYTALFHELIHWTGHPSRLNRFVVSQPSSREEYAFEELIAQLGATYLCFSCDIKKTISHSVHYIDSWLAALKNDKKYFFKAISYATKASEFING